MNNKTNFAQFEKWAKNSITGNFNCQVESLDEIYFGAIIYIITTRNNHTLCELI